MKLIPLITLLSLMIASAGLSVVAVAADKDNEKPCHKEGKQRLKKPRFAELDLNQDTFITLDEFKQKEIPRGDHDTVFGHIDADGNGEITEQEFESHRPPRRPQHDLHNDDPNNDHPNNDHQQDQQHRGG